MQPIVKKKGELDEQQEDPFEQPTKRAIAAKNAQDAYYTRLANQKS